MYQTWPWPTTAPAGGTATPTTSTSATTSTTATAMSWPNVQAYGQYATPAAVQSQWAWTAGQYAYPSTLPTGQTATSAMPGAWPTTTNTGQATASSGNTTDVKSAPSTNVTSNANQASTSVQGVSEEDKMSQLRAQAQQWTNQQQAVTATWGMPSTGTAAAAMSGSLTTAAMSMPPPTQATAQWPQASWNQGNWAAGQWPQQQWNQNWMAQQQPQPPAPPAPSDPSKASTTSSDGAKADTELQDSATKEIANKLVELDKEEKEFDSQFTEWEKQFDAWKVENINHPDKDAFTTYEKQWQQWRTQLLEKKEQMKKRREELQTEMAAKRASLAASSGAANTTQSQGIPGLDLQEDKSTSAVAAVPPTSQNQPPFFPNTTQPMQAQPYMFMPPGQPYMFPPPQMMAQPPPPPPPQQGAPNQQQLMAPRFPFQSGMPQENMNNQSEPPPAKKALLSTPLAGGHLQGPGGQRFENRPPGMNFNEMNENAEDMPPGPDGRRRNQFGDPMDEQQFQDEFDFPEGMNSMRGRGRGRGRGGMGRGGTRWGDAEQFDRPFEEDMPPMGFEDNMNSPNNFGEDFPGNRGNFRGGRNPPNFGRRGGMNRNFDGPMGPGDFDDDMNSPRNFDGNMDNMRNFRDGPPNRFEGMPPRNFDGPPMRDGPGMRDFDGPRRRNFDGPGDFDGPPMRDGPGMRDFDGPRRRNFDGPGNFDGPPMGDFDGPPRRDFDGPQRRDFDGPPRRDFDGPPRRDFDGPPRRDFDGPPRRDFDGPPRRDFDGPPMRDFDGPPMRDFGGPPKRNFEGPMGDFDGPPRRELDGPPMRNFDGPPIRNLDGPPIRNLDGPPRRDFDGPPRRNVDGPPRRNLDGPPMGNREQVEKPALLDRFGGKGKDIDPDAFDPEACLMSTMFDPDEFSGDPADEGKPRFPPSKDAKFPQRGGQPPQEGKVFNPKGKEIPPKGKDIPPGGEKSRFEGNKSGDNKAFPPEGKQFPPRGKDEQLPPKDNQFPPGGDKFPSDRDQFPVKDKNVPPESGQFPPRERPFPPKNKEFPPPEGENLPPRGKQFPSEGEPFPPDNFGDRRMMPGDGPRRFPNQRPPGPNDRFDRPPFDDRPPYGDCPPFGDRPQFGDRPPFDGGPPFDEPFRRQEPHPMMRHERFQRGPMGRSQEAFMEEERMMRMRHDRPFPRDMDDDGLPPFGFPDDRGPPLPPHRLMEMGVDPMRDGRPPFRDDRFMNTLQANTIDYTHRSAASVVGNDFGQNFDAFDEKFGSDLINYRVFDYAHRRDNSTDIGGESEPWNRPPVDPMEMFKKHLRDPKEKDLDRDRNRDRDRKDRVPERDRDRNAEKERDRFRDGRNDRDRGDRRDKDDRGKDREDRKDKDDRRDHDDRGKTAEPRERRSRWEKTDDIPRSKSPDKRQNMDRGRDPKHGPPGPFSNESSSETVQIKDLLCPPNRNNRPKQLVIILRGVPGSGKTYVAKLIKDKEMENGGTAPRILSLDDYFMVEVEVMVTDPETGKNIKKKEFKYEYEACMEDSYRTSLLRAFKKTIDDRFFPFVIVDAVHSETKHYEPMWSYAKQRGFQVYITEMDNSDISTCHKRNVHNRTLPDIQKIKKQWESKPKHFLNLDIRPLLQDVAIPEVEMEDFVASEQKKENDNVGDGDKKDVSMPFHIPSKWETFEASEEKLDKLDGLRVAKKKHSTMEDFLQLPDDYENRKCEPGKKQVRWADLEERKEQDRARAIGFVVGQTDWAKMTDPSHADRALTKTKYI